MNADQAPIERTNGARFVERLAERLGMSAGSSLVYGEPVEREGITVIPVSRARWGFGGGGGTQSAEAEGSGGGGGVMVSPVGYIEVRDGASRFTSIHDPAIVLALTVAGGTIAVLVLRQLRLLLRRAAK